MEQGRLAHTAKKSERVFHARVSEAASPAETTHDVFVDAKRRDDRRRAVMLRNIREQITNGTYAPNLRRIAERMLADNLA